MGDTGLESIAESSGNTALPHNSAAQSGANSNEFVRNPQFEDPELASIVERWPWLSAAVKREVLAIIDAAAEADPAMPK